MYSDNSQNNNKKKVTLQIQFQLINSKYILETSFERTEYLILSMNDFYIFLIQLTISKCHMEIIQLKLNQFSRNL